jgi:hypothetical protein
LVLNRPSAIFPRSCPLREGEKGERGATTKINKRKESGGDDHGQGNLSLTSSDGRRYIFLHGGVDPVWGGEGVAE